nr:MAG TPA: hypothetical protein [Bacteriophage sp.]
MVVTTQGFFSQPQHRQSLPLPQNHTACNGLQL